MIAMGGCEQDTLAEPIEILDPDAQSPEDDADPGTGEEDPGTADPDNGGDDPAANDPDNGGEDPTGNDPDNPGGEPNPADPQTIVLAGDANGNLVIDGTQKQYDCNTTLAIKGGQYNRIEIRNLHGQAGCPIRIENQGLVELVGYRKNLSISNIYHVVISGDGTQGLSNGFLFRDNEYRAVEISGDINYFTLQHAEFRNVANYVISYNDKKVYNGSASSYSQKLKFTRLKATNTGPFINFAGGVEGSDIVGLIRGLEISHIQVSNSPRPRNVVYVGMVEDYDIHDNVFSNINAQNDDHNAMFHIRGNGKFYNNHISNHQGNAIRAWAVSVGTTPKEIHIFNNIVVNSRKYSAFEVQSFERIIVPGKTTYANASVYHNTCGNLNMSKDWYGVVLDAYRMFGGKVDVFNNLAFNFPAPAPTNTIVSGMSIGAENLNERNNLYFPSSKAAGILDEKGFKLATSSKAYQGGLANKLSVDFYKNQRNSNAPSVGAVE